MREAIGDAGHLHTEAQLQQFSRQLADQIEAACRGHKLTCGRRGLPLVPALRISDVGPILSSAVDTTSYTLSFDAASPDRPIPSQGADWTWKAATRAIPAARNQKAFQTEERVAMSRQAPVAALQTVFGWLAYPALVTGILGLLWELIRPYRHGRRSLAAAMTAVLVALLAQIAVVAVIDAMSYPASRNSRYVIPDTDLLVLLAAAGCWLFGAHVYDLVQARRSDNRRTADTDAGAKDNSEAPGPTTVATQPASASD
jgi:hypothetical protein